MKKGEAVTESPSFSLCIYIYFSQTMKLLPYLTRKSTNNFIFGGRLLGGIGILLELLGAVVDLCLLKDVQEEDIERNINKLKQSTWFQDYLKHEPYRKLIVSDQDVRQRIGKFKTKKLDNFGYLEKCHVKLERVLRKKVG